MLLILHLYLLFEITKMLCLIVRPVIIKCSIKIISVGGFLFFKSPTGFFSFLLARGIGTFQGVGNLWELRTVHLMSFRLERLQ